MAHQLNTEQPQAVQLALGGHSFLLTGFAGTGKTTTLSEIARVLPGNVIICSATGISSAVLSQSLSGHTASTVHATFGLMDGRYTVQELLALFAGEDEYYISRLNRLKAAACIIIDEVSMVSAATLNTIDKVMRFSKDSQQVMGGVQRIFSGDFLQLPPVANPITGDVGQPAIFGASFPLYVPHKVHLTEIVRSSEARLSTAIRETSMGFASPQTKAFLASRNVPLPVSDADKLALYGQCISVLMHSAESLHQHPGTVVTYTAVDTPRVSRHFRSVTAEKVLQLKVGAPVMLLRTLSDKLVNGLRGHVVSLHNDTAYVQFSTLPNATQVKAVEFVRYGSHRRQLCKRVQLPLALCFGTTVHKAQGLTAHHVEVHATDMIYPGLLSVAIGRVTSAAGLRVVGFSDNSLIPPDKRLIECVQQPGLPTLDDFTCCLRCATADDAAVEQADIEQAVQTDTKNVEDGSDSDSGEPIPAPESAPTVSSELSQLLDLQTFANPVTATQLAINADISRLKGHPNVTDVYAYLKGTTAGIYAATVAGRLAPDDSNAVLFNDFVTRVKNFADEDLPGKLNELIPEVRLHPLVRQLFIHHRQTYLAQQAQAVFSATTSAAPPAASQQPTTSAAGQGTIRRVGGRTVHPMREHVAKQLRRLTTKGVASPQYKLAKTICRAVLAMTASAEAVLRGQYPETAHQTERRNFRAGCLTHITDSAFELFLALETARLSAQTVNKALTEGGAVLKTSYATLRQDERLLDKLYDVLPSEISEDRRVVEEVYALLLQKFLPVGNNAYRKQLLGAMGKVKSVAHRTAIAAGGETSAGKRKRTSKAKEQDRKRAKTVDSECSARRCKVLRGKTTGKVTWIACELCDEWFHLICTNLPQTLTPAQIRRLQWHCASCQVDMPN